MFKVVIGLGNWGTPYDRTRHNVGFVVVDAFVKNRGHSAWKLEKSLAAHLLKIPQEEGALLVAKSAGFMNCSGDPAQKVCSFFKIQSEEVVVVCDDITLELGQTKITERPGTAGHNGVRDILEKIGPGFIRFRIGVGGKKHDAMDLADHVLSRFTSSEMEILEKKMPSICENLQLLLDKGIADAMTVVNRSICKQKLTEQQ
jgi:PTH1 family peptidyl-tRNA hydrolase